MYNGLPLIIQTDRICSWLNAVQSAFSDCTSRVFFSPVSQTSAPPTVSQSPSITMTSQLTATSQGTMISPQYADHPPPRCGNYPTDHLSFFFRSLKLGNAATCWIDLALRADRGSRECYCQYISILLHNTVECKTARRFHPWDWITNLQMLIFMMPEIWFSGQN